MRAPSLALALALALASVAVRGQQTTGVCPKLPSVLTNFAPYTPGYAWGDYTAYGEQYAVLSPPLGFPAGPAGEADVEAQELDFAGSKVSLAPTNSASMEAACPAGACLTSLDAFASMYAALPPEVRPALAKFATGPNADAAFARMRLTVGPLTIKRVRSMAALPIQPSSIRGLASIIKQSGCALSLPQLVAAKRVFAVDFRPYARLMSASPGSVLEIPVGLFFVGGHGRGSRLMPLAIQFSVNNRNVYSPADSRADWLLAKAVFNAIDTAMHATIHFLQNHFMLNNLCIAAQRNFAPSHPLFTLIAMPCKVNTGILPSGIKGLLTNTTGAFDQYLMLSGYSVVRILPVLAARYDWEGQFLDRDLAARGVADIPGYAYASDAGATYSALLRYSTSVLSAFYRTRFAMAADKQLQGFLRDLGPGGPGGIPGFPAAATIRSAGALAKIVAQTQWIASAQHHAMNTNKPPNYDIVYPASIGKLFGAPPAQKGVLTEANLLNRILLPATVAMPTGSTISGWSYLKAASNFVLSFKVNPPLRPEQQLLHGYSYAWRPPAGCAVGPALASAAATLRARMAHISATIQAREAALAGRLPRYTLLDPREAPYYTFT